MNNLRNNGDIKLINAYRPRAVICVDDPWNYIPQLSDYSLMIVNPHSTPERINYLLSRADYSLLVTSTGYQERPGQLYNERCFWYTSGTTGDSKFYGFTDLQIKLMASKICESYDITDNDRYVSVMPLWHAHGQGFYWATQLAGCETNFLSTKEIRNLSKFDPTFITAIPDILKLIHNFKFDNLRFIRSASSPLLDTTYLMLKDRFNVPVIEAFGMTEALSHCFTNPLYGEQRIGTVGLPDGIDAKIINDHLYIKGPTLFTDQWFDTGDLAKQDSSGYYSILGRSVDQISVRGIKINPVSLETQVLKNVPGIKECIIFGDSQVNCVYVGECRPESIVSFLINLGSHCRPSFIHSADNIPVSASGKVSRKYLNLYYHGKL